MSCSKTYEHLNVAGDPWDRSISRTGRSLRKHWQKSFLSHIHRKHAEPTEGDKDAPFKNTHLELNTKRGKNVTLLFCFRENRFRKS